MSRHLDEEPVYYREIQKNAFLKRIPMESGGGKLRALGHKKPPLKAMWTLFCVHNGRTPYLEQYPEPDSPCTLTHKPTWRVNLKTAKHVTASVKAWPGDEFDFLVATDEGPVRMLAPDWDSMQDWVSTLRDKLHELRVLSKSENVYGAPPVQPAPRAGTRDPTSPLPPTPAVPPVRVPGIELNTPQRLVQTTEVEGTESQPRLENQETIREMPSPEPERSRNTDWNTALQLAAEPSTSQESEQLVTNEKPTSLAKICGQNICLDDSILRRSSEQMDSDEEFFTEIDRVNDNNSRRDDTQKMDVFKQTVVINSDDKVEDPSPSSTLADHNGERKSTFSGTNVTVIEVSNREPPHTAIPVMGPETDVFNFDFKQKVCLQNDTTRSRPEHNFVNILNTEVNVHNSNDTDYGTVFEDKNTDGYGHLSLTTTVNLTGNDVYERLCMASTSKGSPLLRRKYKNIDEINDIPLRKSSLPNLEFKSHNTDTTYEYLFPTDTVNNGSSVTSLNLKLNNNGPNSINVFDTTSSVIDTNRTSPSVTDSDRVVTTTVVTNINTMDTTPVVTNNSSIVTTAAVTNRTPMTVSSSSRSIATAVSNVNRVTANSVTNIPVPNTATVLTNRAPNVNNINSTNTTNVLNSMSIANPARIIRGLHCNIGRSNSQNNHDANVLLLREQLSQGRRNESPKRESKSDKQTDAQQKPIWKRGLTEFSLLTRLRGLGQAKGRQESPTRCDNVERVTTSPSKVVHRSRPEVRYDGGRRRSSSLNNGAGSPSASAPLVSLRRRQAAALVAEQARGAAHVARVPCTRPPVFADAQSQVWIAWWGGGSGGAAGGRCGDRVAGVAGTRPTDAAHARRLAKRQSRHLVDILFHRVPLAKIYILNKDHDNQNIGIKLDSECTIVSVECDSPAARAGLPPPAGRWAVTEVNNRQINLLKGGEDEMNRLSSCGKEVSVLVQPTVLVKRLRSTMRAAKPLLAS